jgi:hypothetical protein
VERLVGYWILRCACKPASDCFLKRIVGMNSGVLWGWQLGEYNLRHQKGVRSAGWGGARSALRVVSESFSVVKSLWVSRVSLFCRREFLCRGLIWAFFKL